MGAGASATTIANFSAADVADFVGKLGEAYKDYKQKILANGVSGQFLADLKSDAEILDFLKNDLGIENKLHLKVLTSHLAKIVKKAPTDGLAILDTSGYAFKEPPVLPGDKVTLSPREIMKKLFDIQGIALDPSDIRPALTQIEVLLDVDLATGLPNMTASSIIASRPMLIWPRSLPFPSKGTESNLSSTSFVSKMA